MQNTEGYQREYQHLSPLDAFAAQGRQLSSKLGETNAQTRPKGEDGLVSRGRFQSSYTDLSSIAPTDDDSRSSMASINSCSDKARATKPSVTVSNPEASHSFQKWPDRAVFNASSTSLPMSCVAIQDETSDEPKTPTNPGQSTFDSARPGSTQSQYSQPDSLYSSVTTKSSVNFSRPMWSQNRAANSSPVTASSTPKTSPEIPQSPPLPTTTEMRRASTLLLEEIRPEIHVQPTRSMPLSETSNSASLNARIQPAHKPQTADDHVTLGIKLHQESRLPQSFHHLQVASSEGHPTGQLLYALALRHGWGCASNQAESVYWLHKAAEGATEGLARNSVPDQDEPNQDPVLKQGKAQIGLALFELGVCYMRGWGAVKDKTMGLRCFEVSAGWGDADAQNECGHCYQYGIGTRKNPKKAARYYRKAEAQGHAIVGNKWIHKSKYASSSDEEDTNNETPIPRIRTPVPSSSKNHLVNGARRLFRKHF